VNIRLRLAAVLNDLDQIASDMCWQKCPNDQIEPVLTTVTALERAIKAVAHTDAYVNR
jgi:hypothetical protein